MLTGKMLRVLFFVGIILSSIAGRICANAQGQRQEINSIQALLQLMISQPDHMADWKSFENALKKVERSIVLKNRGKLN